jgi:hypothetical protein
MDIVENEVPSRAGTSAGVYTVSPLLKPGDTGPGYSKEFVFFPKSNEALAPKREIMGRPEWVSPGLSTTASFVLGGNSGTEDLDFRKIFASLNDLPAGAKTAGNATNKLIEMGGPTVAKVTPTGYVIARAQQNLKPKLYKQRDSEGKRPADSYSKKGANLLQATAERLSVDLPEDVKPGKQKKREFFRKRIISETRPIQVDEVEYPDLFKQYQRGGDPESLYNTKVGEIDKTIKDIEHNRFILGDTLKLLEKNKDTHYKGEWRDAGIILVREERARERAENMKDMHRKVKDRVSAVPGITLHKDAEMAKLLDQVMDSIAYRGNKTLDKGQRSYATRMINEYSVQYFKKAEQLPAGSEEARTAKENIEKIAKASKAVKWYAEKRVKQYAK